MNVATDTWDPKVPWQHGEKRGDLNATILWDKHVGRFQFGLRRRYVGDQYGLPGSDGWEWTFGFVRNPR